MRTWTKCNKFRTFLHLGYFFFFLVNFFGNIEMKFVDKKCCGKSKNVVPENISCCVCQHEKSKEVCVCVRFHGISGGVFQPFIMFMVTNQRLPRLERIFWER